MSYAVRIDGQGWRSIDSPDDLLPGESYSDEQPAVSGPTYKQLRAAAYPPITDGLDAMVKGGQALEDYKAACMAVKANYPKV